MLQLSFTGNMLAWVAQSCVFASIAALLPLLFRVRHPETRVAYGHTVILVCVLLPLLQPWKHDPAARQFAAGSTVSALPPTAASGPQPASPPISTAPLETEPGNPFFLSYRDAVIVNVSEGRWFFWILGGGAALKLVWMLGGLWRIRTYRIAATPLYPVPETLKTASAITHADALFCLSKNAPGPVMMGWLAPIVLLPESFLDLSEESQCGIGCHELLHVRRGDWLVTLIEEFIAALVWFNPGIWVLLSQTRLAREQLVDAESVRLTGAREPYIEALMTVARTRVLDLAPAPLFLRRRHLSQRMHALLSELHVSKVGITGACVSMGAILACTAWLVCLSFPLMGRPAAPQIVVAAAPDAPVAAAPSAVASPSAALHAQIFRSGAIQVSSPAAIPTPVPADPHEPALGGVQAAVTAVDHEAALDLIARARQNGLTHSRDMQPFHFTARFTAGGNAAETGPGELTEIWMNGQKWRWTASLGNASVVRIAYHGQLLENGHAAKIPMRAHVLRNEIFWAAGGFAANAQLRTAKTQWNGRPATCILASRSAEAAAQTPGRLWQEEEFCVDDSSGLLVVHSVAPGTFAVFGYDSNQQFQGRTFPDRITIYVSGSVVADTSFSIGDTKPEDEAAVTPGKELISGQPVVQTQMPVRTSITAPAVAGSAGAVVVHADVNGEGNVVGAEISSTSDPALTQTAFDIVKATRFGYSGTQRQIYLNVAFGQ